MKKFLTTMAITVLGTTTIANSNLLTQIHLNNKKNKVLSNNLTDNSNPFIKQVKGIPNNVGVENITIASNGTIYVGTENKGLYYSTDGINFRPDSLNE